MKKDQDRSRQKKIEKNGLFFEIVKDRKRDIQIDKDGKKQIQLGTKTGKDEQKIERQTDKDRQASR